LNKLWRVSLFIALLSLNAWANGPLRAIVVFGNEKTERQTIVDLAGVTPQTYVNDRLLRDVDDRLTHSGLFKTVKVSKIANPDGTVDLRIVVAEKQLWFVFPVFQAWSGRYSGGGVFGESNLFVPRGSTLFLIQGGNKLSRLFTLFDLKGIANTDFTARTWILARTDDVPLYTGKRRTDEINLKDASYALTPGFQWTNDIQTAVTFRYSRISYGENPSIPLSGTSGNDVSIEFQFVFDTFKRREAFLKGERLKATYEFADTRFGTDFKYHIEAVSWEQAFQFFGFLNYIYSVQGKIGDDLPFHKEFTLGGSSLRGYAERQFRGDTQISTRQDLLFPLYRHSKFSVFGDVFHDLGFLYTDARGIERDSLRNGVGGGLRISLTDILAPVFGLDFGYAAEEKGFSMYTAIGLVDF
jgi:outer membrane protein insertion porin family